MAGAPPPQRPAAYAAALANSVLAGASRLAQLFVWPYFAGQAGSPEPENWAAMQRVLDIVVPGVLPAIAIGLPGPLARYAAHMGLRLPWLHPLVPTLACAGELAQCLHAYSSQAKNAAHAAQIRSWLGKTVRIAGLSENGGL